MNASLDNLDYCFDANRVLYDLKTRQFVLVVQGRPMINGHVSRHYSSKHPERYVSAARLSEMLNEHEHSKSEALA